MEFNVIDPYLLNSLFSIEEAKDLINAYESVIEFATTQERRQIEKEIQKLTEEIKKREQQPTFWNT